MKTKPNPTDADVRRAELPNTPLFLRLPDVLRVIPVSKSTFWSGIKAGRFPKPRYIGRIAVWSSHDIKVLVDTILEGARS